MYSDLVNLPNLIRGSDGVEDIVGDGAVELGADMVAASSLD